MKPENLIILFTLLYYIITEGTVSFPFLKGNSAMA